jgi:nucleoside-diphosphate-sugar epimerase
MKKLLITGIKGFIGYNLYNYLKYDYEIIGIDDCSGLACDERDVPYIHADLLTCDFPDADIVIHLAGRGDLKNSWTDINGFYLSNVKATKRIFDFYSNADRILYASSSSVLEITDPYGFSKAVCEDLAPSNAIGMQFYTVYGDYGRPDMLYRMALEDKLSYKTNHTRDFIHVSELSRYIELLMDYGRLGEVYQMGSAKPQTITDFLKYVGYTKELPFKEVTGEREYTCADMAKIRKLEEVQLNVKGR